MAPFVGALLRRGGSGGDIADDFNRSVASGLGSTSKGGLPWTILSGAWSVNGSMPTTSTSPSSNPIAVINSGSPNVTLGAGLGTDDAVYFRVQDATNWWRLTWQGYQSSSCSTCYNTCCDTCTKYCTDGIYGCYNSSTKTWNSTTAACGALCPSCSSPYVCQGKSTCTQACGTESCNCVSCNPYSCNCSYYNNYLWMLQRSVNNSVSNIASGGGSYASVTASVTTQGNTITALINGSQVYSSSSYSDFATATRHGIGRASYYSYNTSSLDNFSMTWK